MHMQVDKCHKVRLQFEASNKHTVYSVVTSNGACRGQTAANSLHFHSLWIHAKGLLRPVLKKGDNPEGWKRIPTHSCAISKSFTGRGPVKVSTCSKGIVIFFFSKKDNRHYFKIYFKKKSTQYLTFEKDITHNTERHELIQCVKLC